MEKIESLVENLIKYNDAYRKGTPLVSDLEYDRLLEKLQKLAPGHSFLTRVEPEKFLDKKQIRHPVPMLSTEKAYTKDDLVRFVSRVKKEAAEIGISSINFIATPKLDGLAARDDGEVFVTRGNGETGYEISSALKKGVLIKGGKRGCGLGEIVISSSYFDEHLKDNFEHPRNMVVGIISSDTLNKYAKEALEDEAVFFVPYAVLERWKGGGDEFLTHMNQIIEDLSEKTDYPMDGMVLEVVEEEVKRYMGATAHHYRWQIAVKKKGETALAVVEDIQWQVGRTGSITPVLQIRPVVLSGATIRRVTAHNAGIVKKKHIGINAEIEVIRSGEVIPKIENIIKESENLNIPDLCPVCGSKLEWNNDFLKCVNPSCKAQKEQAISHWFKTLDNADWFGIKTIIKLVNSGYDSLEKIYAMKEKDFEGCGFGPVQSKNLSEAIEKSKNQPVDDWRFLAAFGIPDLGKGDSRKLLAHFKIDDISDLKPEDIVKIHGFGAITSKSIAMGLEKLRGRMDNMFSMDFNIIKSSVLSKTVNLQHPVALKHIVFTGKMEKGSREDMQAQARKSGAMVQTSVNSKTDFLVCGENVGKKKLEKAQKFGVKIISETDYLNMLK